MKYDPLVIAGDDDKEERGRVRGDESVVKALATQLSQPEFGPMRNGRNGRVPASSTRRGQRTDVRGPLPLACVLLLSLSHTSKLFFRKNKRCHATEVVYPSWTTQKQHAHQDTQIRNVGF